LSKYLQILFFNKLYNKLFLAVFPKNSNKITVGFVLYVKHVKISKYFAINFGFSMNVIYRNVFKNSNKFTVGFVLNLMFNNC